MKQLNRYQNPLRARQLGDSWGMFGFLHVYYHLGLWQVVATLLGLYRAAKQVSELDHNPLGAIFGRDSLHVYMIQGQFIITLEPVSGLSKHSFMGGLWNQKLNVRQYCRILPNVRFSKKRSNRELNHRHTRCSRTFKPLGHGCHEHLRFFVTECLESPPHPKTLGRGVIIAEEVLPNVQS